MEMPSIKRIMHKGEAIEEYPVDEGQDNANAGNATLYSLDGRLFQVVVWNDRAIDHTDGEVTVTEVEIDDDDE